MLKRRADLLECRFDPAFWKGDVDQATDIRELGAAFLQQDNRLLEAKTALKEPDFVNHVLSSPDGSVTDVVLGRHDEEGEAHSVEHLLESIDDRRARRRDAVEFFHGKAQPRFNEALELHPSCVSAVADEDLCSLRLLF